MGCIPAGEVIVWGKPVVAVQDRMAFLADRKNMNTGDFPSGDRALLVPVHGMMRFHGSGPLAPATDRTNPASAAADCTPIMGIAIATLQAEQWFGFRKLAAQLHRQI